MCKLLFWTILFQIVVLDKLFVPGRVGRVESGEVVINYDIMVRVIRVIRVVRSVGLIRVVRVVGVVGVGSWSE